MNKKLQELLDKRGVKDVTDLTPEEAQQFDSWNKTLSEGELTVPKIKEFCELQLHTIDTQMSKLDNSHQMNDRFILLHTVYTKFINLIESPEKQKEETEKYLNQLLVDKE